MSDSENLPARATRRARLLLSAACIAVLASCTPYQLRSILDGPKGMALLIDPASTVVPAAGTVDFAADGGVPPYTFSIVPPIGGTLDTDTGEYTAPVTAGSVVIRVTDAAGRSADAKVTVQTFATGLTLVPLSPIAVGIGSNVTFTAIGGTPPYVWSFSAQGSGSPTLTGVVDPDSRLYTTGSSAGLDRVMVTDSGGSPAAVTDINVSLLPSTVDYTIPLTSFPPTGTVGAAVPAGSFTLRNSGSGTGSQAVSWELYLSPNASLDSGDTVIGTGPGVTLASGTETLVSISGTFPEVAGGTYYLLARVYAGDNVSSVNDISGPSMVTLAPADIDYIVTAAPSSTGAIAAGGTMSGTFTMRNDRAAAGEDTLHWAAYASADTALGGDYLLARGSQAGGLAAFTSLAVPFGGMWPSTPGSWYLIVTLSADDDVDQSPASNTAVSAAIATTTGPAPANVDYIVTSVSNTGGLTAGDPLTGSFTYQNILGDPGSVDVYWTAYISSNNILDIGIDPVIDSGSEPWLPGSTTSGPIVFEGTWPALNGTWYLIVSVSATDENNASNNERATGSSISTNPPPVNYTAVSITNTGGTIAGAGFSGSFVIQNVAAGGHDGTQFVPWTVYRSEGNSTLDLGTDVVVAMGSLASPGLARGASSSPIPFSGVWPNAAVTKSWYYIMHVGAGDDTTAGDNFVPSAVISVVPPDVRYAVPSVINTGTTDAGGILSGQFSIANAGSATGTQPITWTAYRSADNLYQVTDQVIATSTIGGVAGLGTSGPLTFTGTWPTTGGSWHLIVRISAADDTTTGDNETSTLAAIPLTVVAPNYAITAVSVPAGSTAGQAVSGTITIQNAGPGAGTSPVAWSVYASLGNGTWDAGDTLIDEGSTGVLPVLGSESPGYAGNWPSAPGTYWIVVRASAVDDPTIADAPSASVIVSPPPPPDYTVSFNAAMPWSGLVGTAMSLTGTCQLTIQNLSPNPGSKGITWSVHISMDNVLDGLDTLVQQGSVGALAGSGSTVVGYGGNWPGAPGNFYWLIASVHAADDTVPMNNVVPAPHVCAVGNYRYKEDIEDNSGTGPAPNPANDSRTSNTGLNVPPYLAVGETLAIEGTMDAAGQYDTYKLTVAGAMTVSTCARWATGMDELDFHVWDNVTATDIVSQSVGADSEPGAAWYNVTIPSSRPCYIGTWMYLAGNTSGSAGKTYVILVRGL